MSDLTCQEFIEFLDAFREKRLPSGRQEAFDEHVTACPECQSYLRTYEDSVRVFRSVCGESSVPEEVPAELIGGILEALKRREEPPGP